MTTTEDLRITGVLCGSCGAELKVWRNQPAEQPPCPTCGGINVVVQAEAAAVLAFAGIATASLGSPHQSGWLPRWKDLNQELSRITRLHRGNASSTAVHKAGLRLLEFFVSAYNLKDSLKTTSAIDGEVIEKAVTNDDDLALLADLANLRKHEVLDPARSTRSGDAPSVLLIWADSRPQGGWKLRLDVAHKSHTIDGVEVARRAVRAWRRELKGWGLI